MNKGNDLSLKKLRGSQSKKSLPLASQVQKKYIFLPLFSHTNKHAVSPSEDRLLNKVHMFCAKTRQGRP